MLGAFQHRVGQMKRLHPTAACNFQQGFQPHPVCWWMVLASLVAIGSVFLPFRPRRAYFSLVLFLFIFLTGETSAGKSSLINLLLNEEVLPTCVLQNTLTICEISYGPMKEATIHFDKYKPGEDPIRLKGKDFDRMWKYIEDPVDGERRCKKIEIKIDNELLKVQTYSDGTRS